MILDKWRTTIHGSISACGKLSLGESPEKTLGGAQDQSHIYQSRDTQTEAIARSSQNTITIITMHLHLIRIMQSPLAAISSLGITHHSARQYSNESLNQAP